MTRSAHQTIPVPVLVGLAASAVATILTLVGLWRGGLLTWRNVLIGVILGGGTWGLIAWAIAQTMFMVEEDCQEDKQD